MVVLCEVNATEGIICSVVQGEGITKYETPQKQLNLEGWNLELSRTGNARVAKLVCSYNENQRQQLVGRHRMFFVLEDGTLYLKIKPKSIDADFVAGDLTPSFLRKFNIHEIRYADPNRIIDLVTQQPDGTPYYYSGAITDGEIVSRKSADQFKAVSGYKVELARWAIVKYCSVKNTVTKADSSQQYNVLFSLEGHASLMNLLGNYSEKKLSQLR